MSTTKRTIANYSQWDFRRAMAHWWAQRNGLRADNGGWIRRKVYGSSGSVPGKALAQGYGSLYLKLKQEIWAEFDAWTEGKIR